MVDRALYRRRVFRTQKRDNLRKSIDKNLRKVRNMEYEENEELVSAHESPS